MKPPYVEVRMVEYFLPNLKSADFMATSMLDFDVKHPNWWQVPQGSPSTFGTYLADFISKMMGIFRNDRRFCATMNFDLHFGLHQ